MGNHNEQEVFSPTTKYGSVVYNGFSENATYLISFQKNLFFMGVVCTVVMNCKQPKKIFSMLTKNNIANDECKNINVRFLSQSQVGVTFRGIVEYQENKVNTKNECIRCANGLLYIEKERKSRYQRIDEAEKTAFARGEAEGKEDKLIATVRELEEKQALREEQGNKLYHEALSHTISFRSTRTEWVRLSRGGW